MKNLLLLGVGVFVGAVCILYVVLGSPRPDVAEHAPLGTFFDQDGKDTSRKHAPIVDGRIDYLDPGERVYVSRQHSTVEARVLNSPGAGWWKAERWVWKPAP